MHPTAYPVNLPVASSSAVGTALDRLGYAVLCVLVCLVWAEATSLASWTGMLLFGIYLTRIAVIGRIRRPSPLHHWMVAFVGWVALSMLWTLDRDSTAARLVTYLELLILAWLIWELATTERRVHGLLFSYLVGAAIASGLTLYNFYAGYTTAKLAADAGIYKWETYRYSIAGLNENDLALMLALSIPMSFYLLASRKGSVVRILCWLQLVAGVTAILLTGSRGGLMAAVVAFGMFPMTVCRLPRPHKFASLAVCIALLPCSVWVVPATSWDRFFQLGSELTAGTMTHRTVIWAAGLEMFRDHAFLGVGEGAYGPSILKTVDIPIVGHNTFLSVLVELGVAGALLMALLLAGFFYCAAQMRGFERCLWITLLLTWMTGVSALTWEYRKPTWLMFSLVPAHAYSRRLVEHQAEQFAPALSRAGARLGLNRKLKTQR